MASIKTPGSIFVKLIEANNNGKKQEGASRGDGFCYFLGGRSSGKSTLLNRFLYPTRSKDGKTVSLHVLCLRHRDASHALTDEQLRKRIAFIH
eukprot:1159989-Pelagomonas_calceolata.AAC.2